MKPVWVRLEPGDYEYQRDGLTLASVHKEGSFRWRWMIEFGPTRDRYGYWMPMTGLVELLETAKRIAEERVRSVDQVTD